MRGRSLTIAGAIAAGALVVRVILDWRSGTGWPLLVIAVAIIVALILRRKYPRE